MKNQFIIFMFFFIVIVFFVNSGCKKNETNPVENETKLKAPVLNQPANKNVSVSVPIKFTWDKSSAAESYRIQVAVPRSGYSPFGVLQCDTNVSSNNSFEFDGFNNSTTYNWRVQAINKNGISDWSEVWALTTSAASPCSGIPTVTYEGKTYNTVKIGSQCWLKENLDIGNMIQNYQNSNNNAIIEKYCYNNDPNNCATYGGLYQWDEAMQYSIVEKTRGICPEDWHIPTKAEWNILVNVVNENFGYYSLMSVGQGPGNKSTNESGFSALNGGYRYYNEGNIFNWLGYMARFWSSTSTDSSYAGLFNMDYNYDIFYMEFEKGCGYSIRCVKD